jgi:hypothetical protein
VSVDRSAAGRTAAWLLSCAPVGLPALWAPAEDSLGDASRAALAVLPWLAWIGLPRAFRNEESPHGSRASSLGTAALSLPPIAAAVAVDLGHGRSVAWLACVAVAGLSMIALLGAAGEGRVPGPRGRAYAWAWIALVPGAPLLRCALELGGAPAWGSAPGWLARLADASPIAWAWARASTSDAGKGSPIPWAGLAVCFVLLAIAGLPRGGPARAVEAETAR